MTYSRIEPYQFNKSDLGKAKDKNIVLNIIRKIAELKK